MNAALTMMRCTAQNLTLSTAGCARMHLAAQDKPVNAWTPPSPCRFCAIGAQHAGVAIAPMAAAVAELKRICPRCQRPSSRFIQGKHCVSCYNRDREAAIGKNAKGTRPALADVLHDTVLTVANRDGIQVRVVTRVASRVEAMLTLARAANGPLCFGLPPADMAQHAA